MGHRIFKHFESLCGQMMKIFTGRKLLCHILQDTGWIGEPHSIVI